MCEDNEITYLQPSLLKIVDSFETADTVEQHIGQQPSFLNGCNCGFCVAKRIQERKCEYGF